MIPATKIERKSPDFWNLIGLWEKSKNKSQEERQILKDLKTVRVLLDDLILASLLVQDSKLHSLLWSRVQAFEKSSQSPSIVNKKLSSITDTFTNEERIKKQTNK